MGNTSTRVKQKWNAAQYTQVKVSIDPDLAKAFKTACAASGESMASVLSRHMAVYSKTNGNKKPLSDYSTRQRRCRAVGKIIVSLEAIKEAEEAYVGNIPENLQNSVRYDNAEQSVNALYEAISVLAEVY
jgi:hypothetical protein